MPQPHPGIWPIVLIVCVVVVVLPALWVKWQNDRQRFSLLKMAIEKGMNSLPLGLPIWLLSLRQGVLVLVAGLAPLIVGGLTLRMAGTIPAAPGHQMAGPATGHAAPADAPTSRTGNLQVPTTRPESVLSNPSAQRVPPATGNPPSIVGSRWNGPRNGADGWPRDMRLGPRPGNPPWPNRPGMRPDRGRPFGPPYYIRHMHDVMVRQNAGLALLGVGLVLCLLGVARIAFAFLERRYTTDRATIG